MSRKKRSKPISVLTLISVLILLSGVSPIAIAQENVCSLDHTQITGPHSFSVGLTVTANREIAGFQIPCSFAYGNIPIRCDSASFWGSSCQEFGFQNIKVDNEAKLIYLSAIYNGAVEDNNSPLSPGTHNIATVYFTVDQIQIDQKVSFLKSNFKDESRNFSFLFWTPAAEEIEMGFDFKPLTIK